MQLKQIWISMIFKITVGTLYYVQFIHVYTPPIYNRLPWSQRSNPDGQGYIDDMKPLNNSCHNHNKTNHNKNICIFYGICCICTYKETCVLETGMKSKDK